MVAVEGEESGELHPSVAELLVGVAVESAGINTKHWDTEESEVQSLGDAEVHVGEETGVVTTPVTSPHARTGKSRSTNDERTLAREDFKKSLVSGVEDLVAKQVVHIVLLDSIDMGGVRADSVNAQISIDVVDHIWWLVDIADTRCNSRDEVRRSRGRRRCCRRHARCLRSRQRRSNGSFRSVGQVESLGVCKNKATRLTRKAEWRVNRVQRQVASATGAYAEAADF